MNLADYLTLTGETHGKFAARIRTHRQNVSRWVSGTMPRADDMRAIADATNGAVMPNDFVLPADSDAQTGPSK